MSNQWGKWVNLSEKVGQGSVASNEATQLPHITVKQYEDMQLTIQRLQHRLQIYEGPKAIDDKNVLWVNQPKVVGDEEIEDETPSHPRDLKDYLREQPKNQQRNNRPRERYGARVEDRNQFEQGRRFNDCFELGHENQERYGRF